MNGVKESILKMFSNIQKGTEYVLAAIPEGKLKHSVNENSATVEELAFHISTLPLGAALFAQNRFEKFPETAVLFGVFEEFLGDSFTRRDYVEMFRKSCEIFLDFFGSKSEEEFVNSTYKNFLTRGERTYLEGFLSMQNHLLQHRGSLTSTLRSAGIPVTLRQYWGMEPLNEV